VQSKMKGYSTSRMEWLENADVRDQVIVCLSALVLGIVCAINSPSTWKFLLPIIAGCLAGDFARYEGSRTGLTTLFVEDIILAVQAGLTVALAAFFGFEGTQVLLGAVLGLLGAHGTGTWMLSAFSDTPSVLFGWHCRLMALGVLAFSIGRAPVLTTFCPLFGGFLVASGAGGLVAVLMGLKDATWIGYAGSLTGRCGSFALACQSGGAVISLLVLECSGKEHVAVGWLVGGVVIGALAVSTGLGCRLYKCPSWLEPADSWSWPLLGGMLWALVAGGGAVLHWRQNERFKAKRDGYRAANQRDNFAAEEFERTPLNGQSSPPYQTQVPTDT